MQFKQIRIYDVATYHRFLEDALASLPGVMAARKSGSISKAFQERIMLAVTQVNGCRYCSYAHTRMALNAGMHNEEIQRLLHGELNNVPQDEAVAVLFAEHYAETAGHFDAEAYQRVEETYGASTTAQILAATRIMMTANVYGIMAESLKNRFTGNPTPNSTLAKEIAVVFGTIVFIPEIVIRRFITRLTK